MTGNYYCDYKSYVELMATGKKLVLWGACDKAESVINAFFAKEDVFCIVDSDPDKWGTKICGVDVVHPDLLKQNSDDFVVLVTVKTAFVLSRILHQLSIMEIPYFFPVKILDFANRHTRYDANGKKQFHEFVTYNLIEANMENLIKVRELLSDERSRAIYDIYIEKVKYNIKGYHDITDNLYDHYFSDGIFHYSKEEVFVDGGAFDGGDTIMFDELLSLKGGRIKKAYCFEPDEKNWMRCKRYISKYMGENFAELNKFIAKSDRVELYRYPLSDCEKDSLITSNGKPSTSITNSYGEERILTKTLDEMVQNNRITFIKYDLEGSDYSALLGARQTIIRNHPKLALSIYHTVEDLWRIPLLIHDLVPEYKLFIRHHNKAFWDKILYAAIEEDLAK